MRATVMIKIPGPAGVAVFDDIRAASWKRHSHNLGGGETHQLVVLNGDAGEKVAEFSADAVLAIAFHADPPQEAPAYTAADLAGALVEWYAENFDADTAGAGVALATIRWAAACAFSLDEAGAKHWVDLELQRINIIKKP